MVTPGRGTGGECRVFVSRRGAARKGLRLDGALVHEYLATSVSSLRARAEGPRDPTSSQASRLGSQGRTHSCTNAPSGSHIVTLTVSDGSLEDTDTVAVEVVAVVAVVVGVAAVAREQSERKVKLKTEQ